MYADAQLHHCDGGDITQGAAMAGMPTSGRINNDALLIDVGLHVPSLLAEPFNVWTVACVGTLARPWASTCDCTGTGYHGDICQTPLPVEVCPGAPDCADATVDVRTRADSNGGGTVDVNGLLNVSATFGCSL